MNTNGIIQVRKPQNEPAMDYLPGSAEREQIKAQLDKMLGEQIEIPLVIGGKGVTTSKQTNCVCPHDHGHVLGKYHVGGTEQVNQAIDAALAARAEWASWAWDERLVVFLKAADLLTTKYRPVINVATMLGQSKTVHQAEIEAACELGDFWRFNPYYATQVFAQQPESVPGLWNYMDHRGLEGYVFAVTPFNFTAIAGNLPTAPAMMGCTVVWKPASSAVYSAHFLMKILEEAGLPPGVINMVPGPGGAIGDPAMAHPSLAGVHFTGSTEVFQRMWATIGANIKSYKYYPRIVGETGGKDFIFAHASADPDGLIANVIRGAYEYQGQKCSAASRMYVPESLYNKMRDKLIEEVRSVKMGDPRDFTNFMCAVIDRGAFADIKAYIDYAKGSSEAEILVGGECDDSKGYFVSPTLVKTTNPRFKLMEEEIFGPVMTFYVYPDNKFEETLELCNSTSPYALTGAVFARDRAAVIKAAEALRDAAGNFYINDKPTGAVVNQQPFGGGRASGTNDKAGSMINLARWVTARSVKENFLTPTDYRYPFMK